MYEVIQMSIIVDGNVLCRDVFTTATNVVVKGAILRGMYEVK